MHLPVLVGARNIISLLET